MKTVRRIVTGLSLLVIAALLLSSMASVLPVSAGKNPPPEKSGPPAGGKPPDDRGGQPPRGNPTNPNDPCIAQGTCTTGDTGRGNPINGSIHASCKAKGEVDPFCIPDATPVPGMTPQPTPVPSATSTSDNPGDKPTSDKPAACNNGLDCLARFVCDFVAGKLRIVAVTNEVARDANDAVVGTKVLTTTVGISR